MYCHLLHHVHAPVFHWLPVQCHFKALILKFKAINGSGPSNSQGNISSYPLRLAVFLHVNSVRLKCTKSMKKLGATVFPVKGLWLRNKK